MVSGDDGDRLKERFPNMLWGRVPPLAAWPRSVTALGDNFMGSGLTGSGESEEGGSLMPPPIITRVRPANTQGFKVSFTTELLRSKTNNRYNWIEHRVVPLLHIGFHLTVSKKLTDLLVQPSPV